MDVPYLTPRSAVAFKITKPRPSSLKARVDDDNRALAAADERTQRITAKAARVALNAGSYFIIAILMGIFIARESLGVPSFGEDFYSYSLTAVLPVQSLSFPLLRWYLGTKSDS